MYKKCWFLFLVTTLGFFQDCYSEIDRSEKRSLSSDKIFIFPCLTCLEKFVENNSWCFLSTVLLFIANRDILLVWFL